MQLQIRLTLIATGPLLVFPTMVWAQQNIGDVAGRLNSQIGDIGTLLGAVATVIGVGMLIMSGVKFRAYSTNPQDPNASLGGSIGWLLAGSALVAIPTFLDVGVATLFDGGTQGALDGSNLGLGN
ncbi:MAG: hypothetical protein OXE84_04880 [Rhodobacteraceae bacterium]|nr:hypothetical protein [Paracoccaceae bacterium]MCY4196575.1 hypothetical protein [Paracoccaceae bacterium]